MCGIAGELGFKSIVDPGVIRKMTGAIIHRGPDDEGYFCNGQIGFGHRRLSIIDVSSAGHQPMWTEDKSLAIIFNGEVYNHGELRPELQKSGYRFSGYSDTEVVLNAIHCWGLDNALKRFIGMFAFATWNTQKKELFLVRDRLGVKPLYYQKTPEHLIFGSELKALYAHPEFDNRLSREGLEEFFCFGYTTGKATVFREAYKLPAGHYLHVSCEGKATLTRYWSLDDVKRGSFKGSFDDAVLTLTGLTDSAFGYRLVSDVPVGVFLSGGIDSTFLSGSLKKRFGVDLKHITIGFDDQAYDETPNAELASRDLDLRHSIKNISAVEAQNALSRFVDIWDEPFGDTSGIPTSILCCLARQEVKVALSADGGDELFCGYDSYISYSRRYRYLQLFPIVIRRALSTFLRRIPYRFLISAIMSRDVGRWNPQTVARYEKGLDLLNVENADDLIRVMNEKGWSKGKVGELINDSSFVDNDIEKRESLRLKKKSCSLIDHMMRNDLSQFLGDDILTKVDRASMASSLECRDPFLDHRLVEFAFSLPLDYLYRNGKHKYILKQIMSPWVSSSLLNAPKRGFSIPLYAWLRGPWKPLVGDYLSTEMVRKIGVLNHRVVEKEINDFYQYRGGRAEKIMLMLNFQMWAERWLKT